MDAPTHVRIAADDDRTPVSPAPAPLVGWAALRSLCREHGVWPTIRTFLTILWVCRVSVASVAAGLLMFLAVAQARDLFLDFPGTGAMTFAA
ncbi:MAG: hypothetical protein ABWZ80_05050, partial [Beijerinckiaceae bacterium]